MTESKKPVIKVETSLWGTEVDSSGLAAGHDTFYVEGYSDKREAYDAAIRDGEKPSPIQYRFQYVSVQRASGAPNKEKESYYRSRGYIPVQYADAASYGIDPVKSGFIKDVDGTCRVGSQMLMVCPAAKVAGHARELADKNEALVQSFKGRAQAAADDYNRANPSSTPTAFEFDERHDDKPFAFEEKMMKSK